MIHWFLQEMAGEVPKNFQTSLRSARRPVHRARAWLRITSVFSKRLPNYDPRCRSPLRRSHFENYQLRTVTLSILEAECAFPRSSTSTQLPPRWVPVRPGTHTMCFPPFATLPACEFCLRSKFS